MGDNLNLKRGTKRGGGGTGRRKFLYGRSSPKEGQEGQSRVILSGSGERVGKPNQGSSGNTETPSLSE